MSQAQGERRAAATGGSGARRLLARRLGLLAAAFLLMIVGTRDIRALRADRETVVVSEALTRRVPLSTYFDGIRGTLMDAPVFLFDSGVPGGSVLILAGTHAYEPASPVMAYVVMENIAVTKGRVFVIPRANPSASRLGMLGNAYPPFFRVKTPWGEKRYRIGDRETHPLEQWPDPFTFVHYPSRQNLAYQDSRNMNRTFPGRPDGNLTERASYAVSELIRRERIDMTIDVHEASMGYPVVSTYVCHERAEDMCMMAAMVLSAEQFPMKTETSPKSLRGLTHREVGDYTQSFAVLMETPEPFIDKFVGPMTEELMLTGRDEFMQTAADRGLLYADYDIKTGATLDYRVGRHLAGAAEVIRQMGEFHPEKRIEASWPGYADIMKHGVGFYLHDPSKADARRVFVN
ncbi:MAG TPA: succinylglutamate desuccinylase/aspartoacylase family protein [Vicinamibacterales bacterium]|nr:succinylglutamate desuccinylase/aspartoacylase family protein [Vicinamibacterales bacterium]